MREVLLKAEKINKFFGATKAVQDFSMEITAGEIHGLIGENGSGKSTFSAVIAGLHRRDSGTIIFQGEQVEPHSTAQASEKGIAIVMQEIGTIETISVAANIFLNKERRFAKAGFIDYRAMNREASGVLEQLKIRGINPSALAGTLNLEERKLVELAKAMADKPKLLIVDETSNALTRVGRECLYGAMKQVKRYGGCVLFITHDIEELVEVCDSVTIMRDGRLVTTVGKERMQPQRLKEMMVGRDLSGSYYREDTKPNYQDEVVLEVKDLVSPAAANISFQLHKGEILGIGGLSDCGMHELARMLFGLDAPDSGTVILKKDGKEFSITSPSVAIRNKVAYMSKNRDTEAILVHSPIYENICLPVLKKLRRSGFITRKNELQFAEKWADFLNVKRRSLEQQVSTLSGGNKQKIVLAKWLGNDSRIFIMDCPTRGIDIGVKENIYHMLEQFKREGRSIIMISEEMPELIGMSDRIMVMKDYAISKFFDRSAELGEKDIIEYMV